MGFLASAARSGAEIDIFDAHDEFNSIPNTTSCMFSQATGYGYNPLVLDTNTHTGGVNSQVDFFVRLIKNVTPQFGVKQEGVLRHLLVDTYAAHNIILSKRVFIAVCVVRCCGVYYTTSLLFYLLGDSLFVIK